VITDSVDEIASIVKNGGIVVFPTETVYGIGALATNKESCLRIYKIKNRPSDNPLIVHFASKQQIKNNCIIPKIAESLLNEFSPGALTLVLNKKNESLFSCGLDTVAVRIPNHTKARELIALTGPIAAPSANPSGKPSYTRFEDILNEFSGKVDGILQAEEPSFGMESTVLDLSKGNPILLRTGSIDQKTIESRLGIKIESPMNSEILSPGMKYRHYAPNGKVFISKYIPSLNEIIAMQKQKSKNQLKSIDYSNLVIARIGFSIDDKTSLDRVIENNLDYMSSIYKFLLDCDNSKVEIIYCQEPNDGEFADTIWDRLKKASLQ